ncbi:MAG TPA: alpha/beta hydrolase, partial [Steroidobacteraceae bacterium]
MSAWRTLGRWLPLAAFGMLSTLAAAETSSLQAVGTYAVEETDVTYAQADGLQLRARIYRPKTQGPLPAIVDVHGGAWSSGDRNAGRVYDHALASAGLFVFAIDFRQAPAFQHPAANRDIAKAVRYLRSHAEDLQIEADTIGLVGSSSGGHLAMLAALLPN